jgi:hypothetical protein
MTFRVLIVLILACYAAAAAGAEAKSSDLVEADAPAKAFILLSTSAAKTSLSAPIALRVLRITRKGDKEKFKHPERVQKDNPRCY